MQTRKQVSSSKLPVPSPAYKYTSSLIRKHTCQRTQRSRTQESETTAQTELLILFIVCLSTHITSIFKDVCLYNIDSMAIVNPKQPILNPVSVTLFIYYLRKLFYLFNDVYSHVMAFRSVAVKTAFAVLSR